jgi:hypothetical protein
MMAAPRAAYYTELFNPYPSNNHQIVIVRLAQSILWHDLLALEYILETGPSRPLFS